MGKHVPYIAQLEAVECGAASLAMILAYHGHHAPLSEVRKACGVSRDGSTAKNILSAARGYGMTAHARRCEPDDLVRCKGPVILHWRMEHFVVLERWGAERSVIVDPASGRRLVDREELDRSFTGVFVDAVPGEEFTTRAQNHASRGRYLALLNGYKGLLFLVLLASIAIDLVVFGVPLGTQILVDEVLRHGHRAWLPLVIGAIASLIAIGGAYQLVRERLLSAVRDRLDASITASFVQQLFELPIGFFIQRSNAELMSRVQANKQLRDVLAGQSIGLIVDGGVLLGSLALMALLDGKLALVVAAVSLAYLVVLLAARPMLRARAEEQQIKSVSAFGRLLQILRSVATIKSAGVEDPSRVTWQNSFIHAQNANADQSRVQRAVASLLGALRALSPILVLWFGGKRVLAGDLSAGSLIGFQLLQASFLGPLDQVVQVLLRLQLLPVLFDRMDDVLLSPVEPVNETKCPRLEGNITFENISFRYGSTTPWILQEVSLTIERGKKIALVGASGSGKSTLARLLLGLYPPSDGRILLDGHDLAKLELSSLRRQLGVVLQETHLFDGTIADNLRLGSPTASLDQVVVAARVAQIHEEIEALPQSYETRINASGGPLSGGQRQRLALARAILHRPPIMILDEATSALDSVTESAIERFLSTRSCTRIVIAHRLSTVRDADLIVVLDHGRIVEQGKHDELLALGGMYARLSASGDESPRSQARAIASRSAIAPTALDAFDALRGLLPEDKALLANDFAAVDLEDDQVLVQQDARAPGLYLLVAGKVAIELSEPGLPTWTVAELGPGEVVGELSLLDGAPSSASVRARGEGRALFIDQRRFQDLLARGDLLAMRLTLSLGGLVARRLRDAFERMTEGKEKPTPRARTKGKELALAQTVFGASLTREEIAAVERIGTRVEIAAGVEIAVSSIQVVLAGSVALSCKGAIVDTIDPGEAFGESSLFDSEPNLLRAHAEGDTSLLVIEAESIRELVLSGHRAAAKILTQLGARLAGQFRAANLRLREAVALERGEIEKAHAAREQALDALRRDREADVVATPGYAPIVLSSIADSTAACMTSFLRGGGRAVPLARVVEAYALTTTDLSSATTAAAARFGLACRRLDLVPDDLAYIERPILLVRAKDHCVLVERSTRRGLWVMDPLSGRKLVPRSEMLRDLTVAFELRDEVAEQSDGPIGDRLRTFAKARRGDLGRLLAATLLVEAGTLASALLTGLVVAQVLPRGDHALLSVIVIAASALAVSSAVLGYLRSAAIEHLQVRFDRELLDQLVSHVLRLPISFFDRHPPGELLQRFQAFENVRLLFSAQGVAALLGVASAGIGLAMMAALSLKLSVFALIAMAGFAIAGRLLFPRVRDLAAREMRARGTQQDRLLEVLSGLVTLRLAGSRTSAFDRWMPSYRGELDENLRKERLRGVAFPMLGLFRDAITIGFLALGAREVIEGRLALGSFVAFLGVLVSFLGSLYALVMQVLSSATALYDFALVQKTFAEAPEQARGKLAPPGELRGKIELDQVSFRYEQGSAPVLHDVSLVLERGQKVAIVGGSGSGKSTLGKLLLGLYLPTSGRVLFDDRDATGLDLPAVRRQIGVVLQEPQLMNGTIRENVTLGRDGIPLSQIVTAAERAALHADVEAMPMGYSTLVSEGGSTFSGGQRQRCAIARALLADPAILLFDEATSALDNLTQAAIERNLAESRATRIVIAHRLSTVIDADVIVVLERGRIVEQGNHEKLLARGGRYAALVEAQEIG